MNIVFKRTKNFGTGKTRFYINGVLVRSIIYRTMKDICSEGNLLEYQSKHSNTHFRAKFVYQAPKWLKSASGSSHDS